MSVGRRTVNGSDEIGSWVVGVLMGLLSLFGLFLASRAEDRVFEWFGLLVFLCGVAVIFALIRKATEPRNGTT